MEVCKTCGIVAGTHACNPLDINMKNMRLTIQNQQSEITRLNEVVKQNEIDARRYRKALELTESYIELTYGTKVNFLDQAMSEKGDK